MKTNSGFVEVRNTELKCVSHLAYFSSLVVWETFLLGVRTCHCGAWIWFCHFKFWNSGICAKSWELHVLNRCTAEIKPKGAVCAVAVVECPGFLFRGWLNLWNLCLYFLRPGPFMCPGWECLGAYSLHTRPVKGTAALTYRLLTPALLSRWLGEIAPGRGPPRAVFEGEPCRDKRLHPSAGEEWAEDEWSQKPPKQHP